MIHLVPLEVEFGNTQQFIDKVCERANNTSAQVVTARTAHPKKDVPAHTQTQSQNVFQELSKTWIACKHLKGNLLAVKKLNVSVAARPLPVVYT